MARQLDMLLVVDLESTCWEKKPPPGQVSDIIEVGLCPVDLSTLQRLERRSFLVRSERSQISAFCTELTTLTPEMLAEAPGLADTTRILQRDYLSRQRLWASWGDYDRRQFERVCHDLEIAYPFGPSHLNVKSLFAAATGRQREVGLPEACDALDVTMDGTHHRGHDDAWNIAGILCQLLGRMRTDG